MKFHHHLPILKELEVKHHFMYTDKWPNSVVKYRNLPNNNPKRDIVGTNAYTNLNEIHSCIQIIEWKQCSDRRTYVLWMDGHPNIRILMCLSHTKK